jgi:hypothetical protein
VEDITQQTDFFFRLWNPFAKVEGEKITPESFNSKEVGELLIHLEAAFKAYFDTDPERKAHEPFLSLVEVRNQSLGLHFKPSNSAFFQLAFLAITTAVNSGDFTDIPRKSIEHLQSVQKIVKAKNAEGQFYLGDKRFALLRAETPIVAPEEKKNAPIRGETVLYGQVTKTGGIHPAVQVVFDSGETLTCTVSRSLAKQLGKNLYSKVALKGVAAWSAADYELLEFRIESFEVFQVAKANQAFAKLRDTLGKYWDSTDNISELTYKY